MYATIEADIEIGVIKGHDASQIPSHAHVLITLLRSAPNKPPALGIKSSRGALNRYANKTLVELEESAWPAFVRETNEQD